MSKVGLNRPGPGSHVTNASYMVVVEALGREVGWALGEHALSRARELEYAVLHG